MVDYALSVSDLKLIEKFKDDFDKSINGFPEHYEIVEEVGERHIFVRDDSILSHLQQNGMDTNEPVEIVFVQHRNLQNKVVSCYRFEGQERLDDEWIRSGCASMNALIASSKDDSMRFALRSMSAEVSRERGFE
ncbi:hypothetical protein D3C80_1594980 [compost metagenome]